MIVIAEPYARYTRTIPPSDIESAASRLLQAAERTTRQHFDDRYERLGITVVARVEAGSTRTWVTIGALVTALNAYGSFRQSIDYLVKDARSVGQMILSESPHSLGIDEHPAGQQRRLGIPGQLRRLFARVEKGELSPEEATSQAVRLLERRGGIESMPDVPRLARQLRSELTEIAAEQERRKTALPPKSHRPVLGLPPTAPVRRPRGAIASRSPESGEVDVVTY
jgi:hypothetical protein